MSVCNITTQISEELCIGDSLSIINTNFSNLDTTACNLSGDQLELFSKLITYSNALSNNTINLLNLLNSANNITPVNPASRILQLIVGGVTNNSGSGQFTISTGVVPNNASFVLFRGDTIATPWSDVNESHSFKIFGVSIYTITTYKNGLTTLYTAIPKSNLYDYSWNHESLVASTYNLRIVGYY